MFLEAGAEDMESEEELFEITADAHDLEKVKEVLEGAGIEMLSAEVAKVPKNVIQVSGKEARQLLKLMDCLEDHDDVQQIWANFDISDDELSAAQGE